MVVMLLTVCAGSVTLSHWQRLATPHFGGVLERRPGVQVRGEQISSVDEEVYTMLDMEEDGECQYNRPTSHS